MSRRNKNKPNNAVATTDAFSNPLFRLGYGSQSPLEATEYPLTRMTDNYALLNSLYRDNWVVQNVVDLMVDDMLREWYKLRGVGPEYMDELEKVERIRVTGVSDYTYSVNGDSMTASITVNTVFGPLQQTVEVTLS